jgi:Ras-related protein Rab-35
VVLKEDARRFAEQMNIQLFETSAKDNINVEEVTVSQFCYFSWSF